MRDYARKIQSSQEKITSRIKQVVKFLIMFAKIVLTLLIVGLIALFFLWIAIPHSFVGNKSQNFMFILKDSCSQKQQIYYAFFDATTREMRPLLIPDSYLVQIVKNEEPYSIDQIELAEYFSYYQEFDTTPIDNSWLVKQLVQQEIEITVECQGLLNQENYHDLSSLVVNSVQKELFHDFKQTSERFKLWMQFKMANWQEVQSGEGGVPSLPTSSDCSIAVLNGTEISGYAQLFSSILESSGYRVVRVDSLLDRSETSIVAISKKETCEQLGLMLSEKLLNGTAKLTQSDDITQRYRADLVVVLGRQDIPILFE